MTKQDIMQLSLGITGILILGFTVGFLPALGVFLMLWGNNIMLENIYRRKSK